MGNQQQGDIALDRSEGIYLPNDTVSGNVLCSKRTQAYILLTGTVYYEKRKKKTLEYCEVIFFSAKCQLIPSSCSKQCFQIRLDENLPPSFNNSTNLPRISYSINLIYSGSKDRIHFSRPIRVCPRIQIDQPFRLKPFHFGPIDNLIYGTIFEVVLNRSAFKCTDSIEIYYELQNPNEEYIDTIDVSLGAYYLVESNVWQKDLSHSVDQNKNILSKEKLIRSKVSLSIPHRTYLPPSFQYKYNCDDKQSLFKLTIDYKVQFRIYLGNSESLWQVDVPIVLYNEKSE